MPAGQESGFVDRAWEVQHKIEERARHVGQGRYGRILRMARKPTQEEFERTTKITLIGMLLLGYVAFMLWLVSSYWIPCFFNGDYTIRCFFVSETAAMLFGGAHAVGLVALVWILRRK
ncbi:MAG: protein translocase SEC61 complex subunit gamma [Methanobacteriota archaeon]